ncbi:MAG: hypothetical protein WDN08_13705 [Rhizomicrobium sp.]
MRSFISRAALLVKVTERIWPGHALRGVQDMGEARGQHARLAGTGAGQHQHRPVGRQHRRALLGVQAGQIGRIARHRRRFGRRLAIAAEGVVQRIVVAVAETAHGHAFESKSMEPI